MANPDFALPQSSWAELKKMINAYFLADRRSGGEPVKVPDVAQHAAMDATWISRNNRFFQSLGLIAGKQKKSVTDLGRSLGLAISHSDEQEIQRNLARTVHQTDFLSRLLSAVAVRGGMDGPSLQRYIAITAEAPKSTTATTGARAVIQMLVDAAVLADDGGTFRVLESPPQEQSADEPRYTVEDAGSVWDNLSTRVRTVPSSSAVQRSQWLFTPQWSPPPSGGVTVNLTLTISAENVEEVERLLTRLGVLPPRDQPPEPPNSVD